MPSTPSRPRPAGLPSSPRPNRATNSAQSSPYNPTSGLLPVAPTRSRPEFLTQGPSSLHVRSRSQPPRVPSSHAHRNPPSSAVRPPGNEETYASSRSRSRERSRPRLASRNNQEKSLGAPTTRNNPPSRSPTPDPGNRQAKVNESSGDGYAIWNAVSTVASALTINVSKAWNSNIQSFAGEETPPGQESRLTQAMKAYHIAKARDISDLPSWLFNERERRAADVQTQPGVTDSYQAQTSTPQGGGGGETAPPERLGPAFPSREPSASQPRLRGTDRLKAMRDAKRGAREPDISREGTTNDNPQAPHVWDTPLAVSRPPRIGLPSGPQRGRR